MRHALFLPVLAAAAALAADVADAREWRRQGTVITPRGAYTFQGAGSCADRACSRSAAATGPAGRSVTVSGSIARTDTGLTGSRTVTGPNGGTITRSGTITFAPPAD